MDCMVAATASVFICARHHIVMDQVKIGKFDQGLRSYGLRGRCHSVGVCLRTPIRQDGLNKRRQASQPATSVLRRRQVSDIEASLSSERIAKVEHEVCPTPAQSCPSNNLLVTVPLACWPVWCWHTSCTRF